MPWRCVGKVLQRKVRGRWVKQQTCGSAEKCKGALRLMYAQERQKRKPARGS
jgi:hypothetical protein